MKNLNKTRNNKFIQILLIVLAIDIVLILIHTFTHFRLDLFNLDRERNVPTIYQTIKIILTSFVFLYLAIDLLGRKTNSMHKYLYFLFSISFLFLGIDEVGEIHENFEYHANQVSQLLGREQAIVVDETMYSSAPWLIYYLPIFAVFIGLFLFLLNRIRVKKDNVTLERRLMIGISMLLLVPLVEYLNTSNLITSSIVYDILAIIEEGIEMFAISYFFAMFLSDAIDVFRKRYENESV